MTERHFPDRDPRKIQQATLAFLVRENNDGEKNVLLAMKKRGFGEGLWNGVGGKIVDSESDILTAAREIEEEIGVFVQTVGLKKAGILHFYFPDDPEKANWNQDVHVYLVEDWLGDPQESEEMRPEWFSVDSLPFKSMWDDDSFWLPRVLNGEKIEGWFSFDESNKVSEHKISNMEAAV